MTRRSAKRTVPENLRETNTAGISALLFTGDCGGAAHGRGGAALGRERPPALRSKGEASGVWLPLGAAAPACNAGE